MYELLIQNFKKCVENYHLINSSPINETIWEDINSLIFSHSNIEIYTKSNGGHSSGMDINCSLGKISNKSAKYTKNKQTFSISSYRLTRCHTLDEILTEIDKRKNFDYYSFIVREEQETSLSYDWFLIPSSCDIFNPRIYTWKPLIGKKNCTKDKQLGWETNEINGCKMCIRYSMSSQLWIYIETKNLLNYIIANCVVNKEPKYNYLSIPLDLK